MSEPHCPACAIAAELTEHRDHYYPPWSPVRAAYNYARIIAARSCPEYKPERVRTSRETPVVERDSADSGGVTHGTIGAKKTAPGGASTPNSQGLADYQGVD